MGQKICCPKCGSDQITADQKGFSGGKALAGAVLTGGIGLLAGTIGSKEVIITCLKCGNQWKAGDLHKPAVKPIPKAQITAMKILMGLLLIPCSIVSLVCLVFLFTGSSIGLCLLGLVFFGTLSAFMVLAIRKPNEV